MMNQELFSKGLAVTQLAFSFLIVGLEVMKNHELRNVYLSFIQVLPFALRGQHRTHHRAWLVPFSSPLLTSHREAA